jgi:aldose 1-epimerase
MVMAASSPHCVSLQAGSLRAELRADLGASLAGLWWHNEPLLRSTPAEQLQGPRQSACFVLLPYSNRIGHCAFEWEGQPHKTRPNFEDHPHSLHGVGWQRPWTVVAQDAHSAELALRHEPDGDWPFAFEARQHISLKPDELHWQLSLHNTDSRTQPAGLGWHPYFLHRDGSRLQADVTGRWDPGADALPRTWQAQGSLHSAAAELRLDHCFDGWSGEAWVSDARHRLQLSASTHHLVVFTPPDAPHFCVEPVSHVNNAVQAANPGALGLVALPSGARLEAWMRLRRLPPLQETVA